MLRLASIQGTPPESEIRPTGEHHHNGDVCTAINAGITLCHLTLSLSEGFENREATVASFKKLLGNAWTIRTTGHSIEMSKDDLKVAFFDLCDEGLFLGEETPKFMLEDRRKMGIPN